MAKHSEKDYILPILIMLYETKGDLTTEDIKSQISNYITLNEDDMRPLPSRNKKEPGYYQIVGNLISHRNPNLFKFIRLIAPVRDKNSDNRWQLNEEGVGYIASIIDATNSNIEIVNGLKIDDIDQKIVDFAKKHNLVGRPTTDQKMAKMILEINNYTCQFEIITGKSHKSFNSKEGNQYVEAHHLIPMKASKDFFPRNLDRPSNIVCLCPTCHAKLHHGDLNERKKLLKLLYDKYIMQLNEEEIYIGFEELFNKYYS